MNKDLKAAMQYQLKVQEDSLKDTIRQQRDIEVEVNDLLMCPSTDPEIMDRMDDLYEIDASDRDAVRDELEECYKHWNYLQGHRESEVAMIDMFRRWLRNYGD